MTPMFTMCSKPTHTATDLTKGHDPTAEGTAALQLVRELIAVLADKGLLQPDEVDALIQRAAAIEHAHPRPPRLKQAANLIRLSKPA